MARCDTLEVVSHAKFRYDHMKKQQEPVPSCDLTLPSRLGLGFRVQGLGLTIYRARLFSRRTEALVLACAALGAGLASSGSPFAHP